MIETPKTLTEAIRYYSDAQTCIDAVAALRWSDGSPVCPKCGLCEDERKHYWLNTQKRWKCYGCRKQFSVKVGTIFEDSPLSLDVWMVALWMLVNCKNGVSSYEIARATGIAQKSAWFVLQRLRLVLKDTFKVRLAGQDKDAVEADECYIGGRPKNMHAKRRLARRIGTEHLADKAVVMGILDRNTSTVRAEVIPAANRKVLEKVIFDNVHYQAKVYTDQWSGYDRLHKMRFVHETVNHMNEYVRGTVHTNGIENFWSCLKRTLAGTYVCVEPFHLDRYLDEQMFRYNNRRNMNDGERFRKALSQVEGKRLTWDELTAQALPKGA